MLDGLASFECPECGRAFDPSNPETYTLRPPLVRWKLWLPGLALGLIGGTLVTLAIDQLLGSRGLGLWMGVPFAVAAIAVYGLKHSGMILAAIMTFAAFIGTIISVGLLGMAGIFCTMILVVVFIVPVLAGSALGFLLRVILKDTSFSQRGYLPILALLAIPLGIAIIEAQLERNHPVETVRTSGVIHAPADQAWEAMMFYEEVTHDPPWILRVGLARPVRTIGRSRNVGDVKTCLYDKGRITKEVTAVEPGRRLDFIVTEQQIGYERDVRLHGGSFIFEEIAPDRTRITLVTTYESFNAPHVAWRRGERYAIRTLHEHVIEGMRREIAIPADPIDLVHAE